MSDGPQRGRAIDVNSEIDLMQISCMRFQRDEYCKRFSFVDPLLAIRREKLLQCNVDGICSVIMPAMEPLSFLAPRSQQQRA